MKRSQSIKLLAALALTSLSFCGQNKTKSAFALQGNYQTAADSELSVRAGGIGCVVNELKVLAWTMKMSQTSFEGAACKEKAIGKLTYTGTFSLGDPLAFAPSARAINYKIDKVTITPMSKSWTSLFGIDLSKGCNIGDAALNQELEVTGRDCGLFGRFPVKDAVYFASFAETPEALLFSPLAHEALDSVGTDNNPAKRNQDLSLKFIGNK